MVKIKCCGMTNGTTARRRKTWASISLASSSTKRANVGDSEDVRRIARSLGPEISKVGVFVEEETLRSPRSWIIASSTLPKSTGHRRFPPDQGFSRVRESDRDPPEAGLCLFDSYSEGFGGSGQSFDLSVLPESRSLLDRTFIAGGIDEQNVEQALRLKALWRRSRLLPGGAPGQEGPIQDGTFRQESKEFYHMKRYFGPFGGQFVPETLMPALDELEEAYGAFKKNKESQRELAALLADYAGRPTPLYLARNLSARLSCKVYLKREDLLHTGAHKINNTLGQIMLARFMGKKQDHRRDRGGSARRGHGHGLQPAQHGM